ncbi:MAG: MFS transporter, partial [Phenylobacterium sp.]
MAFLGNDAVNRVNLHTGIQALAQAGGGVFFLVFLLRAGVPIPVALLAQAAIMAVRLVIRPIILPLVKRWGIKPLLIAGTLGMGLQYPVLAQVHGVGPGLLTLCAVAAVADVFYWPAYHAYFAAIGDAHHRGHQVSARDAMVSVAGIVAPLMGGWALVTFGPGRMFAAVGLIQALAAVPLFGAPNVAVRASAPGTLRAARLATILAVADGWLAAWFIVVWQIALFVSLGSSFTAYGGAMALAALAGAVGGMLLGRHIDGGGGQRAVAIAMLAVAAVLLLRAVSLGSPWLAVAANALGAPAYSLLSPTLG